MYKRKHFWLTKKYVHVSTLQKMIQWIYCETESVLNTELRLTLHSGFQQKICTRLPQLTEDGKQLMTCQATLAVLSKYVPHWRNL